MKLLRFAKGFAVAAWDIGCVIIEGVARGFAEERARAKMRSDVEHCE